MSRNILLDWSGTVVNDLPPVLEATNRIFAHYGRPELSIEEFRENFRLPYKGFYDELLPGVPMAELDALYHEFFDGIQDQVSVLPGAREFLDFCRATGRRVILLSTIKANHFDHQAGRLGLREYFEPAYVGVNDKRRKIAEILGSHALAPGETLFAGDMVHDIQTARHGGVLSVAVLTGFDPLHKLAAARPDVIVPDLAGLAKLLAAGDSGRETAPAHGQIVISGLEVDAMVGVLPDEHGRSQRLSVSLTIVPDCEFEAMGDDIGRTVDYAAVAGVVRDVGAGRHRELIETLAADVAEQVLAGFPAREVVVEVRKFVLPDAAHVAVRLRRRRSFPCDRMDKNPPGNL